MIEYFTKIEIVELDALFNKKVAGKDFKNIVKITAACSTETFLYALIRCNAMFTGAIDELVTYLGNLQNTGISEQSFRLKSSNGAGV